MLYQTEDDTVTEILRIHVVTYALLHAVQGNRRSPVCQ